jgi:hypothetical protein
MLLTKDLAASASSAVIALIALAVAANGPVAKVSGQEPVRDQSALVAAYALLAQSFEDFPKFLDSDAAFAFRRTAKQLELELDRLKCDLPLRLAFSTQVELVSLISGKERERVIRSGSSAGKRTNLLVITRPIGHLDNRSLLLLSSDSPRRTSILLVAPNLSTELLYDSMIKATLGDEPPMGSVVEVTIRSDSVPFIEETRGLPPRQFEVNLRTPSIRRIGSR